MKIEVSRKEVYQAMSQLIKVSGNNTEDTRLVQISTSPKSDAVNLTCSNIVSYLSLRVPAKVEKREEFHLYFEAKAFKNLLRNGLSGDEISLFCTEKGGKVVIQDAIGYFEIHQQSLEREPSFFDHVSAEINDQFNNNPIFNADNIFDQAKRVSFAASADEARPVLQGINFNDGAICATNGWEIAVVESDRVFPDFLLPAVALKEFLPVLDEKSIFSVNEKVIAIKNERMTYRTQLIDGHFPDWRAIVPKKDNYAVRANIPEMQNALRAPLFIRKQFGHSIIKISLEFPLLVIESECEAFGSFRSEYPCVDLKKNQTEKDVKPEVNPFWIAFNTDFFSDMLRHIGSDNISMKFISNNAAGLFESENNSFKMVIMPLHLG